MDFSDVVFARRSIRRFRQERVSDDVLRKLLDFARMAPSGKNSQNLRFCAIRSRELVKQVFEQTAWAGFVAPKRNPQWGVNAPDCFIAVTIKRDLVNMTAAADAGAAIENILLGAVSFGLGTCWIGAFNKENTHSLLKLDAGTELLYLVAIGYPAEEPVCEDAPDEEHIRYYLDDQDQIHVPKLPVDALTEWM